jgi:copper resistance protein D
MGGARERMSLYHLNVTLHVLAALFWLGGMMFLGLVGARVLRSVEPPALRAELFRRIGAAFRDAGWVAIAILLVTGVANLHFRGMLSWAVLGYGPFWTTPYGTALLWKLVTVGLMITISAVHDFVDGPRASRARPGSPEAVRLRRRAALLARVNVAVGVVLVFTAVRLARGG